MSVPIYIKSKDVQRLVDRGKDWVELHSRLKNPALPALKSYKVLGQRRFLQSDVDEFLAENTTPSNVKE